MPDVNSIPPRGDFDKAEKYVNQLVALVNQNKVEVWHTDLKKFDPTSLKDHYTIGLKEYQIEISHSKHPNTEKDSYVMIFNNLKNISEGSGEKVILAYVYLADSQFSKFKIVADRQIYERERAEEEKKFNQALEPIDQLLDQAKGTEEHHVSQSPYSAEETKEIKEKKEDFSASQIHQI